MPKQLAPATSGSPSQPPPAESRGQCAVCGAPVLVSQARERDKEGRYSHVSCAAKQSPPAAAPVVSPVVSKGPCSTCGKQVLATEERLLNSDRTYRHLHCLAPPVEEQNLLETLPPRREVAFETTCVSSVETPGSRRAMLVYGTTSESVFREFFLVQKKADEVPCAVSYRWRRDMEMPGILSAEPVETAELQLDDESVTLRISNSGIYALCKMLEAAETFWIDFIGHGLAKDPEASLKHVGLIFLHACVYPYVQWVDDPHYYSRGWVQQELLIPKLILPPTPSLHFSYTPCSTSDPALLQLLAALIHDDAQPSYVHFFSACSALGSSLLHIVAALDSVSGDSSTAWAIKLRLDQLAPALKDVDGGKLAAKERNGPVLAKWIASVSAQECGGYISGLADLGAGPEAYELSVLCEEWSEVDLARNKLLFSKGLLGKSETAVARSGLLYALWKRAYEALLACREAYASLRTHHRISPLAAARPVLELPASKLTRLVMHRDGIQAPVGAVVSGIVYCHRVAEAFQGAASVKPPSRHLLGRLERAYLACPFHDEADRKLGTFGVYNALTRRALALPDFLGEHQCGVISVRAREASCGFASPLPFHASLDPPQDLDTTPSAAMPHHVRLVLAEGKASLTTVVVLEAAEEEDAKEKQDAKANLDQSAGSGLNVTGSSRDGEVERAKRVWVSVCEATLRRGGATRKSFLFLSLARQLQAHLREHNASLDASGEEDGSDASGGGGGGGGGGQRAVASEALVQSLFRAVKSLPAEATGEGGEGASGGGQWQGVRETAQGTAASEYSVQYWLNQSPSMELLADFLDDPSPGREDTLPQGPGPAPFTFF